MGRRPGRLVRERSLDFGVSFLVKVPEMCFFDQDF